MEPLIIRVPAPALVLLVGAAGSGKSTFAARHFAADEVLSSDGLREVLTGDPGDQSATRLAFSIIHRDVVRRLAAGRRAVVDATNVQPFARRALIRRAAGIDAPAIAFVLALPADLVLRRNAARVRPVPKLAVREQLAQLEASLGSLPTEGFARVVVLRSPDEVAAVTVVADG